VCFAGLQIAITHALDGSGADGLPSIAIRKGEPDEKERYMNRKIFNQRERQHVEL